MISLFGGDARGRSHEITAVKVEHFAPAVRGLFGAIGVARPIEERVPGAVIAVELVVLAELLEYRLGAIDLIGGRIGVVIAENAEQRTVQLFRQIDRGDRALVVEVLGIVDDHIAAPAIDRGVDPRQRAGGEVGMTATGAEADDADFAGGIGLSAQPRHGARGIAHDLRVGNAAGGADAGTKIVGRLIALTEIEMVRNRRIAMMGEFAHHFHRPFIPARQVMDDNHAGKLTGARRARVIGFALVAVVSAESHRLRLQALIVAHVSTPCSEPGIAREKSFRINGRKSRPPRERRSFRAAVEHSLIRRIPIDKFDRVVGTRREGDIAHQWPAGKLAFDMSKDAVVVVLGIENGADADIGNDLLRRNLHFRRLGIGTVALAGDILRVVSGQWKIVVGNGGSGKGECRKHKYSASGGRTYDLGHAHSQSFAQRLASGIGANGPSRQM